MLAFKSAFLQRSNFVTNFVKNMFYYAVARGHKVGIYETWPACEQQVKGFQNARYKKFKTRLEAENFIKENGDSKAKDFLHTLNNKSMDWNSLNVPKEQPQSTSHDFWPASDGDSFDYDDNVTDEDLLNALYEVEGLPDIKRATKRKANFEDANNSKQPKYESEVIEVSGYTHIGQHKFPIDNEGYVVCYTDGSCINNGKADARAGFGVYFGENHAFNASKPVVGRVTNNVGEIQAAVHAIQIARDLGIRKLCISTDSQFLIKAATMWISAWKRKDWRLKNGEPVKNEADFKVLDLLLSDKLVEVRWNYVKGHANILGNEMADKLARDGAAEYTRLHSNKAYK